MSWTKVLIKFVHANEELSKICIPTNALLCKQSNCTLYSDIILVLKTSGTNCIPMSKSDKTSTFRPIAGWNEYVKEHYSVAQDALWWWKLYNKPKSGAIYHKMRSTKSLFKCAPRSVRKSE